MRSSHFAAALLAAAVCGGLLTWWALRPVEHIAADADGRLVGTGDSAREMTESEEGSALADPAVSGDSLEHREVLATEGIFGKVVELGTERPLDGFWAYLVTDRERPEEHAAEARTDKRGRFQLPLPGVPAASVFIEPEYGWRMIESPIALESVREHQRIDLLFHARPMRSATVRGILVDSATQEPLPEYLLIARQRATFEEVDTDADGRFETTSLFPEGSVTFYFIDARAHQGTRWNTPMSREHLAEETAREELRFELSAGPTYHLDLSKPPDMPLDSLMATLWLCYPDEREPEQSGDEEPVRPGSVPWVRFRPLFMGQEEVSHWILRIASRAGFWQGEARVDSAVGIYPGLVPLALTRRGQIEGEVKDPQGPLACRVVVHLTARSPGIDTSSTPPAIANTFGRFTFDNLAPGEYELLIASRDYCPRRVVLGVASGRATPCALTLERERPAGSIRGSVLAATEEARQSAIVRLRALDSYERNYEVRVRFESDALPSRGTFEFEGIPAGEYSLLVRDSRYRPYTWLPQVLQASPPAQGLEFRELADDSSNWIRFVAIDAESGQGQTATVYVWTPEGGGASVGSTFGAGFTIALPRGPMRWAVAARGYATCYGDETAVKPEEGRSVVTARLSAGFGLELEVRGPASAPIEGAEIRLDDKVAGTTDATGCLRVQASAPPHRVDVRYRDWTNSDPPGWARWLDGNPHVVIRMAPAE